MQTASSAIKELKKLGSPTRAKASIWFFKTGKGQYGHGDVFYGVTVPEQRTVARHYAELPLKEIDTLLQNKVHECRLTALFILVRQYENADDNTREKLARFYLSNLGRVNNWDLVDSSAPHILGRHLLRRNTTVLYRLARSKNLWERRIAVMSTFAFIRLAGEFGDTLKISKILLKDGHDLIQKAVGWMLREVGNRSLQTEMNFLGKHAAEMPRTMLRYAIEKFPEDRRKMYLDMRLAAAKTGRRSPDQR